MFTGPADDSSSRSGMVQSGEMVGRAVVLRHRQAGRQRIDVVAHATPQTRCATSAYVSAVRTSPSISRFSPSSTSIRPVDVP